MYQNVLTHVLKCSHTCSTLYCHVLQCITIHYNALQCTTMYCNGLQYVL